MKGLSRKLRVGYSLSSTSFSNNSKIDHRICHEVFNQFQTVFLRFDTSNLCRPRKSHVGVSVVLVLARKEIEEVKYGVRGTELIF